MKTDLFQQITDRIAAQLEQGVRPWAMPWKNGKAAVAVTMPHNIAGRAYRGANAFWLMMHGQAMGYPSQCWLTFNQAKAKGGNVRKGEKGVAVFFWKFDKVKDKATGEDVKRVMVRQYTVFNVSQCEGVEAPTSFGPKGNLFERVQAAEAMVEATGADVRWGGAQAYFVPSQDYVQMPPREAFRDADGLYSTLFHELGHWTGHESRLARTFGRKFGDDAYAFEELVAELTSAFVCGSQGFASVEREDHASYIANWLNVLKNDSRAFITAASMAQKAADLIIGTSFAVAADDDQGEPEDVSEAVAQAA